MHLRTLDLIPWNWIVDETRHLCSWRAAATVLSDLLAPIAATNGQVGGFLRTDATPALRPEQRVLYLGDLDLSGNQIEASTRRVLERGVQIRS